MTALREYERLEASGLWRATANEQRREVIVSVGDATLTITDMRDQPLAHWSLAAVHRTNPGERPAIYSPDGDPDETLELDADEATMIDAIEKVRSAIDRARPHPGRLRMLSVGLSVLAVLAVLLLWLPGALVRHTVSVVPDIKRQEIGRALLDRIERVSGRACTSPDTRPVLDALARRTGADRLVVLPAGVQDSMHLPGGIVLLNKALIEDFEDPAVAAGYVLAERVRAGQTDPLAALLRANGPIATFRLLTTGALSKATLDAHSEHLLVSARDTPTESALLTQFEAAEIPSTPYAYARDITGETVLGLIEADPMAGVTTKPVLRDRDWVLLQNICGG